ncbi:MAG: tetratricopeptide repeat protein, partial [Candidatus Thermoplasmatota archaeon]|nr:tetratricopeptide repeat protein [Candidatus Thermoplasmatota archaeon]
NLDAIYIPLGTGGTLAVIGLGLLVTRSDAHSRWFGSYVMWLFGLALILFMPLNESSNLVPAADTMAGYSDRDMVIAYLGLGVSLLGSSAFIIEDFQRRITGINLTLGEAKYISGKYDEAVESYGKALKADYNNAYIWYSKGTALLRMGLYKDALDAFQKATKINPDISGAWDEQGIALSHLKRYSEAIECHEKAISLGGGAISLNNKGNALNRWGRYEMALEAYEEAVKLNPGYEIAWYNKARTQRSLKAYDSAVTSFDEAIRARPDFPEAWHQRGATLREAGRYGEALHSMTIAIQLKPSLSLAWLDRQNLIKEMKEKSIEEDGVPSLGAPPSLPPEMAILEAPEAAEEKSLEKMDDPELLRSAGLRLARAGDYAGAISLFDRALERDQENILVRVSKGMTYMRMNRLQEALSSFEEIIDRRPSWVGPRFMGGLILGQMGRYDEAGEYLDRAIELQPKYADAWNLKGIILASRREYTQALDCFDHALDINPGDAEAWRAKGKALDRLGRLDDALKCYEKALILEPGVEEAKLYVEVQRKKLRSADELFEEGIQMAKTGRLREALDKLERTLELRPGFADAWYIKGIVHGAKKEYYTAMECFSKVLDMRKDDVEALFGMASAQMKENLLDKALDTFEHLLQISPTYADAWCERGIILCDLNRYEEAFQSFEQALALEAGNEKAIRYKEKCVCQMDGGEKAYGPEKDTLQKEKGAGQS